MAGLYDKALGNIIEVLKAFRNVHNLSAAAATAGIGRPPLPATTRWLSVRDSVVYYDAHWPVLADLAAKKLQKGDNIRRLIENLQIRRAASDLLSYHDPIGKANNRMQAEGVTLGESVEIWLDLLNEFPKEDAFKKVLDRSDQALSCPFFLVANVLDHRFQGRRLSPEQLSVARKFVEEEEDALLAEEFTLYLAKDGPFRGPLFDQKVSPVSWWKAGSMTGLPVCLSAYAIKLHSCYATSAGLERQFSTLGTTYGKLRTQLGIEKAGKLAFMFRLLNRNVQSGQ